MNDRSKDITKFSYESYRVLKKNLGEYDAVIEVNELLIKEFNSNSKAIGYNSYVEKLSEKHNVIVDSVKIDLFNLRIRQYYIVSVYQAFETFISKFKREFTTYFTGHIWITKHDGETVLENIVQNVKAINPKIDLHKEVLEAVDYYRLVRNYMSHTNRDSGKIALKYKSVSKYVPELSNIFNYQCTINDINNINFDDFKLFSNCVKHLAFNLSIMSKPSNETIAIKIFELEKESIRKLRKTKNNELRYKNSIDNLIRSKFGRFSNSDLEETRNKIISLLA